MLSSLVRRSLSMEPAVSTKTDSNSGARPITLVSEDAPFGASLGDDCEGRLDVCFAGGG
jgi:hypothetical protein